MESSFLTPELLDASERGEREGGKGRRRGERVGGREGGRQRGEIEGDKKWTGRKRERIKKGSEKGLRME
jgi:hypothetical protein